MIPSGTSASDAASDNYGVILLYHRFDDNRYPSTSTSVDQLKKHINILTRNGFKFATLEEFLHATRYGFKRKLALITIDDGYRSTLRAYSVLKKLKIPFVLFLYMEAIDQYPDFLTSTQIKEMLKSGLLDLGIHSYSHPRASNFSEEDIRKAIKRFHKIFGYTPNIYSYPYGEYTPQIIQIVKKYFSYAFTQDIGTVSNCTNPYLIPRIPAVGSWASENFLETQIKIRPLCIKEELPISYNAIKDFDRCEIYTSTKGWKPIKTPKDLDINPTKRERVGIKCWKQKKVYQRIWLVIPP